jgi:hypothetical protein
VAYCYGPTSRVSTSRTFDLTGSRLSAGNLRNVNLRNVNLRNVNLRGADLSSADLARVLGLTEGQLSSHQVATARNVPRHVQQPVDDDLINET